MISRILIVNPFGIGDVLFTTPVIHNLRRVYPDARIVYIANRRASQFLKNNPHLNDVIVYERDEFNAVYRRNPLEFYTRWYQLVRSIKDQQFDLFFDFTANSTFSTIAAIARIPVRVGYNYRGRGRALTHKIELTGFSGRHVVQHHLDLLKLAGIVPDKVPLDLHLTAEDKQWADNWLAQHTIDRSKPIIAVVPGGGQSWGNAAHLKRWPPEKFAALVDKMIAQYKATVILCGDVREEQLCNEVARLAHFPIHVAAGQTSLTQMAALFKQCRLAIVNDGGPLHIAVAAGVKTVGIFGPVDDVVYGPYPRGAHVVAKAGLSCQPCYRNFRMSNCSHISCLKQLSVEDVYQSVQKGLTA